MFTRLIVFPLFCACLLLMFSGAIRAEQQSAHPCNSSVESQAVIERADLHSQ